MPGMPRTNKQATKIAYKILGKPENMKDNKNIRVNRNHSGINRSLDRWYNHKV